MNENNAKKDKNRLFVTDDYFDLKTSCFSKKLSTARTLFGKSNMPAEEKIQYFSLSRQIIKKKHGMDTKHHCSKEKKIIYGLASFVAWPLP